LFHMLLVVLCVQDNVPGYGYESVSGNMSEMKFEFNR